MHVESWGEGAGGVLGDTVERELRSNARPADNGSVLLVHDAEPVGWPARAATDAGRRRNVGVCDRQSDRSPNQCTDVRDSKPELDRCVLRFWERECGQDVPDLRDRAWGDEPQSDDGIGRSAGRMRARKRARHPGDVHV